MIFARPYPLYGIEPIFRDQKENRQTRRGLDALCTRTLYAALRRHWRGCAGLPRRCRVVRVTVGEVASTGGETSFKRKFESPKPKIIFAPRKSFPFFSFLLQASSSSKLRFYATNRYR